MACWYWERLTEIIYERKLEKQVLMRPVSLFCIEKHAASFEAQAACGKCENSQSSRLLYKSQDFIHMACDFDFAPFFEQFTVGIQHKSGALYAHHFFAIHILFFDDIKLRAHGFFFVGEQGEIQFLFADKVLVRLHAVARNANHGITRGFEGIYAVAKTLRFGGAARGGVFGVEIHHQRQVFGSDKIFARIGRQGE